MFVAWRLLSVIRSLALHGVDTWPIFHARISKMLAKMDLIDDFETSLQVLRGFETDITAKMNDIKEVVLRRVCW
ncbi:hypothetical protein QOZ80_5AG0400690 [Eleusine coracana subsp. coracana]|nr:hypothetical protein QOZ80_5AG0400690 [Eleusine coracana subsp. coracana]